MLRLDAKVSAKGQTVIPKPIRDQMGIRPGDTVYFRIEEGRVILEVAAGEDLLEAFLGAYEKRSLPEDVGWDHQAGGAARTRFDRARGGE